MMIPVISVEELEQKMNSNADFFLLDVRQPEEHQAARIRDGVLIPLGELGHRMDELNEYRDKEIVVYCRSGNRSGHAVQFLNQHGYRSVNLTGGIIAWSAMQRR